MEDEKIITNNEENNYEDIDIIEDAGEVTYSEVVQIVEIDESEPLDVGTDSAFPALGDQTDLRNHAKLNNRELPEQHPITAITGLREELDGIHALKTVESDKLGHANYFMWQDEEIALPSPKTGFFVSIDLNHKISKCRADDQIFGVTVDEAGFVGIQEYNEVNKPQGDGYTLVATSGLVKVRCDSRVVKGNYVMSDNYGVATTPPNGRYGYYVISRINEERSGDMYAVISLDSTMNHIYQLSDDMFKTKADLRSVSSLASAALNAATSFRDDCKGDISSALQNSQNALNNANSALGAVENLGNDIVGITAKVDAVNDQIIIAAHDAVQEKIKDLNSGAAGSSQEIEELQKEIGEIREDVEQSLEETRELSEQIQPIVEFENDDYKGAAAVVASIEDNTVQLAAISKCLSNDYISIDTWGDTYGKAKGQIYYAEDTGLYYYFDFDAEPQQWISTPEPSEAGLSEAIASVRQKVDKDQAMVENLVSFSGKKEETVDIWDRYEEIDSWEQKKYLADPHIIYYDRSTQLYWQCDLTNLEAPWSSSEEKPSKAVNVLTDDDINKVYYAEDTKLYYCYYNGGWHSSEASTAKLVKTIALIKQTADENSASIDQILKGDGPDSDTLAAIRAEVKENESNIEFLTSYAQKGYTKLDEPWNPEGKTLDVVYYAKDSKDDVWKYWYYKSHIQTPDWFSSVGAADAGLIASLADVSQTVSNQESKITDLTSYQGELKDAITRLEQSSSDDGAYMESLVMNISKYTVGKYSQAYGLTVEEAMELLRDGTVFVPNEDTSESYDRLVELGEITEWSNDGKHTRLIYSGKINNTQKYWYWNETDKSWTEADFIENTFTDPRQFSRGTYYVWHKTGGYWADGGNAYFAMNYILGGNDIEYMVIQDGYTCPVITISTKADATDLQNNQMYYVEDELRYYFYSDGWLPAQDPNFEVGALYYWNTDKENPYWQKVATVESNTLNRAISQMRQSVTDTAAEFTNNLTNVKGDLAGVTQRVNEVEANYETVTTFDGRITSIEQKSDKNEAKLSLLVADGVETIDNWDINERTEDERNKVFYVTSEEKYYYWNGKDWFSTDDANDFNLASKISSAGIIAAINSNGDSNLKISASQVNITGSDINLDGYVKFTDLEGAGTTAINGSNITTGTIDANRLNIGKENQNRNLLTNGNFLNGVTGWGLNKITGTTLFNYADDVPQGISTKTATLYITGSGDPIPYLYLKENYWIPVTAGKSYTVSFWLRRQSNQDTKSVEIHLIWKNAERADINPTAAIIDSGANTSWTRKHATCTAPSGATRVEIRCAVHYGNVTTDKFPIYIAGLMFEEGNVLHNNPSSVTVDPTGIDIYNGAFKMYDSKGNTILTVNEDDSGNMYLNGNIRANSLDVPDGYISTKMLTVGKKCDNQSTVITENGIDIYDGAFKIYDSNNRIVFTVNKNDDGGMWISGSIHASSVDANGITTGKITAQDGYTYFDLNNSELACTGVYKKCMLKYIAGVQDGVGYEYNGLMFTNKTTTSNYTPSNMDAYMTYTCIAVDDSSYGNLQLVSSGGIELEAKGGAIFLTGSTTGDTLYYDNICVTSDESKKTNIVETDSMLGKIRNSGIYSYNYKSTIQDGNDSGGLGDSGESGDINIGLNGGNLEIVEPETHYGLVIGEDYNTPSEVISSDGGHIDLYSMISLGWKGIQELADMVDTLTDRIKALENQNTTEE